MARKSKLENRSVRVNRIARKLARHWSKLRSKTGAGRVPLARRARKSKVKRIIAYDLETTRIKAGTPEPLYLTAFCDEWRASVPIQGLDHLAYFLKARFLIEENNRARFVAWNGNHFDVYLVGLALLKSPEYEIRPYLTRSKNLRGMKVTLKGSKLSWEFLDGMSMTGQTATLKKFLSVMAPGFGKLEGPDFEREEFDARNPSHVAYAERDSEGLYRGLMRAQEIVLEHFGVPLQPTIGNCAIRIFQARMPEDVACWEPDFQTAEVIRKQVMRGGFCHIQRKYEGRLWKYDINQAYAAAMREAWLPGGRCFHIKKVSRFATCAIYRVRAENPRPNGIPFYYINEQGESRFDAQTISETWITSIEHKQLSREGWKIEVLEGVAWEDAFNMREYVDTLERLRTGAPDGPSGALGTMLKAIGNNSYGKTVEMLDGAEYLLAMDKPEGFHEYQPEEDLLQHVWFRFKEPQWREYHQPQIGAFITAHVRMEVRRAALAMPEAFIYADTDCVAFDQPVDLPIDPKRYGYWKEEEKGADYYVITKKVYARKDGSVMHAKGLNIKKLKADDFARWFKGESPVQKQVQRQNFIKVMTGAPMFRDHTRRGQIDVDSG